MNVCFRLLNSVLKNAAKTKLHFLLLRLTRIFNRSKVVVFFGQLFIIKMQKKLNRNMQEWETISEKIEG